ncbi:hypothetical protein D3C75_1361110 [compost metagenome]
MLEEYFEGEVPIYLLPKLRMKDELRIFSYPRGVTLNIRGEVLRVEVCGAEFVFDMLMQPLRKIL